jgi:uncharacterized protein (DUF1778 family)
MIAVKVRMAPDQHKIIAEYAKQKGQSMSKFLLHSAINEIRRHVRKPSLRQVVETLVEEALEKRFPARGNASGGIVAQTEDR